MVLNVSLCLECTALDSMLRSVVVGWQANGSGTPRSASRRAPAPMPAAAKEALTENGGSRPRLRPANGKASPAKPSDKKAADSGAWSEAQELALVQVLPLNELLLLAIIPTAVVVCRVI